VKKKSRRTFFSQSLVLIEYLQHATVYFEHEKVFEVPVSDDFVEYCQEDALSIEVWGHRTILDEETSLATDTSSRSKTLQERLRTLFCALVRRLLQMGRGHSTPISVSRDSRTKRRRRLLACRSAERR